MKNEELYQKAHDRFLYFNGALFYKNKVRPWRVAASNHSRGYLTASLNGKSWYVHRLVYFMHTGVIPKQIDHINRIKTDNRIENLREATGSQNIANTKIRIDNTSGCKGVSWHKQFNKWRAYKTVNGVQKSLGLFEKKEDAALAAKQARIDLYGDFA